MVIKKKIVNNFIVNLVNYTNGVVSLKEKISYLFVIHLKL
jgi:hypothetical protein